MKNGKTGKVKYVPIEVVREKAGILLAEKYGLKKIQIIPTILEKSFEKAEERLETVKDLTSWIQIDVIDGKFVYGKSFELELVKRMDVDIKENLLDIHLLVNQPARWINKCKFVNASRIIGQVEMMSDREEFVKMVKDGEMEAGLAYDIDTKIDRDIPTETDVVLLMGRKAGFGEYEFNEKVLGKIKLLKQIRDDEKIRFKIAVDGGVNTDNIKLLEEAGVDIVYSGKYFEELIK
ncbi:hypothetical protein KKC08_02525 [Patescibacteria group bacterium]|nr:hypothetical protein [Patescibacteria group bacterium]MCG2702637.1 hypothetical protein [Candidatus Parcubacteria bacterium]MBU4209929.1 hypothetical protein [Patescibacteria group bacterium]MBU4265469.1 hypothetical protein [Patescibacteria group bacterium]MBU4390519.1 hypothetical protein [Patescibacteria group bacterium]